MRKDVQNYLLCVAFACAAIAFAFADDGPVPPLSQTQAFSARGTVKMDLSAGDYTIRAASSDQIHVTGTCDDPDQQSRMHADIAIKGATAKIVTYGPHNNAHFVIEVPQHSNLMIRLSAGNLEIRKIEGDLDVSSHAGDVEITVGNASGYRSVNASVYAGDVSAPAFGGTRSGLFRSLHWSGNGTYKIYAHVGAGDLSLLTQ